LYPTETRQQMSDVGPLRIPCILNSIFHNSITNKNTVDLSFFVRYRYRPVTVPLHTVSRPLHTVSRPLPTRDRDHGRDHDRDRYRDRDHDRDRTVPYRPVFS
jgi:hypothetical protein